MISNILTKIFNNVWPMLTVFIVAISLIRFFYLRNHRDKFSFHKEFSYLIAIIYIWLLFEILTMTELNATSGVNLVPFTEMFRGSIGTQYFNYNVLGNILIFLPFGYLMGVYIKPKKIWSIIVTTLVTSGVVEFVQLKIGRAFDIDDIILNLVGAVLGYLLFVGLNAIHKRLPSIFRSDLFYNILCLCIIILFAIYVLGYWGKIFS